MSRFMTTGKIAEQLGVSRDAVAYAILRIGIKPLDRAGMVRVFPERALQDVKTFLEKKNHKQQSSEVRSGKTRR